MLFWCFYSILALICERTYDHTCTIHIEKPSNKGGLLSIKTKGIEIIKLIGWAPSLQIATKLKTELIWAQSPTKFKQSRCPIYPYCSRDEGRREPPHKSIRIDVLTPSGESPDRLNVKVKLEDKISAETDSGFT